MFLFASVEPKWDAQKWVRTQSRINKHICGENSLSLTEARQTWILFFTNTRQPHFFTNCSANKESTDFYIFNRQGTWNSSDVTNHLSKIKAAFFMQFGKLKSEKYVVLQRRGNTACLYRSQVPTKFGFSVPLVSCLSTLYGNLFCFLMNFVWFGVNYLFYNTADRKSFFLLATPRVNVGDIWLTLLSL